VFPNQWLPQHGNDREKSGTIVGARQESSAAALKASSALGSILSSRLTIIEEAGLARRRCGGGQ